MNGEVINIIEFLKLLRDAGVPIKDKNSRNTAYKGAYFVFYPDSITPESNVFRDNRNYHTLGMTAHQIQNILDMIEDKKVLVKTDELQETSLMSDDEFKLRIKTMCRSWYDKRPITGIDSDQLYTKEFDERFEKFWQKNEAVLASMRQSAAKPILQDADITNSDINVDPYYKALEKAAKNMNMYSKPDLWATEYGPLILKEILVLGEQLTPDIREKLNMLDKEEQLIPENQEKTLEFHWAPFPEDSLDSNRIKIKNVFFKRCSGVDRSLFKGFAMEKGFHSAAADQFLEELYEVFISIPNIKYVSRNNIAEVLYPFCRLKNLEGRGKNKEEIMWFGGFEITLDRESTKAHEIVNALKNLIEPVESSETSGEVSQPFFLDVLKEEVTSPLNDHKNLDEPIVDPKITDKVEKIYQGQAKMFDPVEELPAIKAAMKVTGKSSFDAESYDTVIDMCVQVMFRDILKYYLFYTIPYVERYETVDNALYTLMRTAERNFETQIKLNPKVLFATLNKIGEIAEAILMYEGKSMKEVINQMEHDLEKVDHVSKIDLLMEISNFCRRSTRSDKFPGLGFTLPGYIALHDRKEQIKKEVKEMSVRRQEKAKSFGERFTGKIAPIAKLFKKK